MAKSTKKTATTKRPKTTKKAAKKTTTVKKTRGHGKLSFIMFGEVRNFNGKPPGTISLKRVIGLMLEHEVDIPKLGNPRQKEKGTVIAGIVAAQLNRALKGDTFAFREIADRFEGKAVATINSDVTSGGEKIQGITVRVVRSPEELEQIMNDKDDDE